VKKLLIEIVKWVMIFLFVAFAINEHVAIYKIVKGKKKEE